MKNSIFFVLLLLSISLYAQENAINSHNKENEPKTIFFGIKSSEKKVSERKLRTDEKKYIKSPKTDKHSIIKKVEKIPTQNSRIIKTNEIVRIIRFPFANNKISNQKLPNLTSSNSYLTLQDLKLGMFNSVTNLGDTLSGQCKIGYFLSVDENIDINEDFLIGTNNIPELSPGNSHSVFLDVDLSDEGLGVPDGTYNILFFIDYQDEVSESDENDNIYAFVGGTISIDVNLPNLTLLSNNIKVENEGTEYVFSFGVRNAGIIESPTCKVGFYLSLDNVLGESDYFVGERNIYPLGPNHSRSITFSFDASDESLEIPTGNYNVIFYLDYLEEVLETSEIDNVWYLEEFLLTIPEDKSANLTRVSGESTVDIGEDDVKVSILVINDGEKTAVDFEVGYYLINIYNSLEYLVGSDNISSLSPQQTFRSNLEVSFSDLSDIVPEGTYDMMFNIDHLQEVTESNESDNRFYWENSEILVKSKDDKKPNIALTERVHSFNYNNGLLSNFDIEYTNNGNLDSDPFELGWYISSNDVLDKNNDILFKTERVDGLRVNSTRFVSNVNIDLKNLSLSIEKGFYYIMILFDNNNEIIESEEMDNIGITEKSIYIFPKIYVDPTFFKLNEWEVQEASGLKNIKQNSSKNEDTFSFNITNNGAAILEIDSMAVNEDWITLNLDEETPFEVFPNSNSLCNFDIIWDEIKQVKYADINIFSNDGYESVTILATPNSLRRFSLEVESNPSNGGYTRGRGNYYDSTEVVVTAYPYKGWRFVNWTSESTEISRDSSITVTITSDTNLVANFEKIPLVFTVYATSNPDIGGQAYGDGSYEEGSFAIMGCYPNNGWLFTSWTSGNKLISNDREFTVMVKSDTSFVANFQKIPKQFSISTSASPDSAGVTYGDGSYDENTEVTIEAIANPGWQFVNWTENQLEISKDSIYIFNVDSDHNFTANFDTVETKYLLTIGRNELGIGKVSINDSTWLLPFEGNFRDTVILEAIPNEDYVFENWSGDISDTLNPIIVIMASDKNIRANFRHFNTKLNHFETMWLSDNFEPMNIILNSVTIDGNNLSLGDEIGVFDGEFCAGGYKVNDNINGLISIIISKDNPDTQEKDGFAEGNKIRFKLWKESEQIEYNDILVSQGDTFVEPIFEGEGEIEVELSYQNITGVNRKSENLGTDYSLGQNYPNPFNPTTIISFYLPKEGHTTLKIYDLLGKEISELFSEFLREGLYEIEFNAENLSSGVYIYQIRSDSFTDIKKMILTK